MQLRWTEEAANDLERIADYLLLHAPDRAEELLHRVYDAPAALLNFPNRGRPGKREGTRELVLAVAVRCCVHSSGRCRVRGPHSPRCPAVALGGVGSSHRWQTTVRSAKSVTIRTISGVFGG
jgi:plasmid stabilization system protein ParE